LHKSLHPEITWLKSEERQLIYSYIFEK